MLGRDQGQSHRGRPVVLHLRCGGGESREEPDRLAQGAEGPQPRTPRLQAGQDPRTDHGSGVSARPDRAPTARTRLKDIDLVGDTILVHGKGNKQVVLPIGFPQLRKDLELYLIGRNLDEYLLHRTRVVERPLDPLDHSSIHRWFKACLKRAGLPETVQIHELRHSAADNPWRATGNLILAQQLLRHQSPATTATYLHPNRDGLAAALRGLEESSREAVG